jgi:CRP-like cAMP-binding protein
VVTTQGAPGDQFYAVADGSFDVAVDGRHVRTMERGSGFGEIALLANRPRTATITAYTAGTLLALQREPFLVAVTGSEAARRAAFGTMRRFGVELDAGDDVGAAD